MNNGLILLTVFSIPIVLLIVLYISIRNRKKRQLETLDYDWANFEKAIANLHINGVIKYGTELIWNVNLTDEMLKKLSDSVDELIIQNSELENLKNLIYNKKIHWNRDYVGTP